MIRVVLMNVIKMADLLVNMVISFSSVVLVVHCVLNYAEDAVDDIKKVFVINEKDLSMDYN